MHCFYIHVLETHQLDLYISFFKLIFFFRVFSLYLHLFNDLYNIDHFLMMIGISETNTINIDAPKAILIQLTGNFFDHLKLEESFATTSDARCQIVKAFNLAAETSMPL